MKTFALKALFVLGMLVACVGVGDMASNVGFGILRGPLSLTEFRPVAENFILAAYVAMAGVILVIVAEVNSPSWRGLSTRR